MTGREKLSGQPLWVLSLVLGGWVALRILTWMPPQWGAASADAMELPLPAPLFAAAERPVADAGGDGAVQGFERGPVSLTEAWQGGWPVMGGLVQPVIQQVAVPVAVPVPAVYPAGGGEGPMAPAGYQLMWVAGLGQVFVPRELAVEMGGIPHIPGFPGAARGDFPTVAGYGGQVAPDAPAPVPLAPGLAQGREDRWSADAWMLARKESDTSLASGRPLYGGSQAGAVLRYSLAPTSPHRPIAYLRASTSLGAVQESEVALGLGARPLASIPVTLAAEARGFRGADGKTRFRPAALAYTEVPPFRLPLGFTGETYLQGGYVGGRFKTGFIDGQLRVDRPLADLAGARLRLGGGIWGGAQKGASRLDIGPGATASLNIAGTPSRVSLDWRLRLLGDSEPKSGPALTISAGF